VVSTFAGSDARGFANGTGTEAQFNHPFGVAVDSSGNVYVADTENSRIRKITPEGLVSTFAGSDARGFANGAGTEAQFNYPHGVTVDSSGNVYVADTGNSRIRKITPGDRIEDRMVSTIAGSDARGFENGIGTEAQFNYLTGVAVDSSGNVYVADLFNFRIRKVTPADRIEDRMVSTIAGTDTAGFANGTGTEAQFNDPTGVAADSSGNIYVADYVNHRIRKITPGEVVSTIAGRRSGYKDAAGTTAQFKNPTGVAVDSSGNVYVADTGNQRIRKIEYKVP